MFTKKEVYEFLGQYSKDAIDEVLKQLGFKSGCNDYPDDIVEQVEKVFGVVDETSKALPDGTKAIMLREGASIAQTQLENMGIEIPRPLLIELLRPVIDSRTQIAQVINAVGAKALIDEIEAGQTGLYEEVAEFYRQRAEQTAATFTPEVINKLVETLRPKTERKTFIKVEPDDFDIDKFLAENYGYEPKK